MKKESYVARAKSFIRSFAPYLEESNFGKALDAVSQYNCAHFDDPVELHCGSNRIVFESEDFVVKIDKKQPLLPSFGGCREEMKMWQKAISDGAAKWFAPILHYEYDNRDWYIMPRADMNFAQDEEARDWMNEIGDEQYYYYEKNVEDLHNENVGTLDGPLQHPQPLFLGK